MTRAPARDHSAVWWLTAQAAAFGVMAALLGVVANALFLAEYGASWLPVTYLFIAVAGVVVSGAVARSARSGDLQRIASSVLGCGVVILVIAWVVAAGTDGAWVSGPLLVLFPVLLQLGFVFIGGQAGRILDIAGIKAHFPRIVAGFPVGAVVGGVLAPPMLGVFGRTEHLILATAVAQAAFLGLVVVTGRRFAPELGALAAAPSSTSTSATKDVRRPWRELLGSRYVLLIIGYQVLSAVGSQLADFLVFDRAAARYADGEDLARFVGWYTAVMNVVSIVFLAVLAGVLLRRFGLRLGIAANPAVLAVLAGGMMVVTAAAGGGSLGLLLAVSAARIADIALTDGTTRTSINATYQVLPADERLAVQASVEGVGVPVAIGASGVLILVLDALPFAVGAMVVATAVVCVVWTWVGLLLYRQYAATLVHALTRRSLLDEDVPLDGDEPEDAAARALLASADEQDVRLGLEMLTVMASPGLAAELAKLADDPRPETRSAALVRLAAAGDVAARDRLRTDVIADSSSTDAEARRRAARSLGVLDAVDRVAMADLLRDADVDVRCAALESVQADDVHALGAVLDALADARTSTAAAHALERLGDAVAPAVHDVLAATGTPAPPFAARVVRAATFAAPGLAHEMLDGHVDHADRELGLTVLERLAASGSALGSGSVPVPPSLREALDRVLLEDARHAARITVATVGCTELADDAPELLRALDDELDIVRRRVAAVLVVRYGVERLGAVLLGLDGDDHRRSIATEALEVILDRADAALALPVLRPDLTAYERADMLPASSTVLPASTEAWLADLIHDPHDHWRAPWLRACALHAATVCAVPVRIDADALRLVDDPVIDELLEPSSPPTSPNHA